MLNCVTLWHNFIIKCITLYFVHQNTVKLNWNCNIFCHCHVRRILHHFPLCIGFVKKEKEKLPTKHKLKVCNVMRISGTNCILWRSYWATVYDITYYRTASICLMHTIFNQSSDVRVPLVLVQYKVKCNIIVTENGKRNFFHFSDEAKCKVYGKRRRNQYEWNETYVNM